jgi:hypothetical protein
LRRQASELWIDQLVRSIGVPRADLFQAYRGRAERYAAGHPGVNIDAAYDAVIRATLLR